MENQEDPAPKPKDQPLCEECKQNPSKYKCPGCAVRSCGLSCVKAHKQRTGCTGKRNQTQFVPISQFDDNLLISGTFFLVNSETVLAGFEAKLVFNVGRLSYGWESFCFEKLIFLFQFHYPVLLFWNWFYLVNLETLLADLEFYTGRLSYSW